MHRRNFCQATLLAGGALALSPWLRAAGAEVHATNVDGKELNIAASAIDDLAAGLRGPLLLPGNAAYDEARQVLNPTIDKHPALIVQPSGVADVMRAVQFLFFKRSFAVLVEGLRSADQGTRQAAVESLGRLYFPHAFDPLVRIFREFDDAWIRRTALHSIGMIPQLQAGDFLLEVLRYEPEPLRSDAKQLLANFPNRDFFTILRQHYDSESGPVRAELEEILHQAGLS